MRLSSSDGAGVALWPTGYQFGDGSLPRGDRDANWLLVRGEVRTSTGDSWSFHDACLTTWDAVELLAWLRAAAQGQVAPTDAPTEESERLLAFTEPNLGFSLARIDDHDLTLRVHLSLECAPSRPDTESDSHGDLYAYSVALAMTRADLLCAADAWQAATASYPGR